MLLEHAADAHSVGMSLSKFLPDLGILNREAQLGRINDVGDIVIAEYTTTQGFLQPWVRPHLQELATSPVFMEPRILAAFTLRVALALALVTIARAGTDT